MQIVETCNAPEIIKLTLSICINEVIFIIMCK